MEYKIFKATPEVIHNLRESRFMDSEGAEMIDLWVGHNRVGEVIECLDGKDIHGFCLLEWDNNYKPGNDETVKYLPFTIRGMWVAYRSRREGLGSELIRETLTRILAVSKEPEVSICFVNISAGAEEFYEKLGFTIAGVRLDVDPNMSVGFTTFDDLDPILWTSIVSYHFGGAEGRFAPVIRF